jgi:hypothetical protein
MKICPKKFSAEMEIRKIDSWNFSHSASSSSSSALDCVLSASFSSATLSLSSELSSSLPASACEAWKIGQRGHAQPESIS